MKHSLLLFFVLVCLPGISQQAPFLINYQGVARSASGDPMTNRSISVRFRILQGSGSGTQVFSETQSINTGAFGLFTHQIGSVSSLAAVNWSAGPYFLEVAVDSTNGNAHVPVGTQQLVSVPYALFAASAPSPTLAFNNTTGQLSVGGNTVTLNTGGTTINTAGALSSTLNGNSYDLFTPSVTVSPALIGANVAAGMAQVTGAWPNYSIMVAPVIGYNPLLGVLTVSSAPATTPAYSYTYAVVPQVNYNSNVLSVGPPSNSVTIAGGALNLGQGGAISVTGTNPNYTVSTPIVSVTASPTGLGNVTGTFPAYVVDVAPTFSYNNAAGALVVSNSASPAISYTYNTTPVLTFSNGILSSGPSSNSVNLPGSSTVSLNQGGAISVTGANPNYTISTPVVSVSASPSGLGSVTGTFPNYVMDVSPTFSYNNAAGVLVVANSASPSISYTYNMTPALSFSSGVLSSGPASNSVAIPGGVTPTITGAQAVTVSGAGNSYTVSAPVTSVIAGTGISVSGSAPNYTVSATPASISGQGAASVSNSGNSYTVSVPVTTVVAGSGISISGSAPDFTVSASPASIVGQGAASVNNSGNSYTVDVPVTSITGTNGLSVSGSAPNYTLSAPQPVNLSAAGGGISTSGSYPNITLTSPSVAISPSLAIMPTPGLLQKFGTYPNYSLVVAPVISYNALTGVLSLTNMPATPAYSYTYNVTPNLSVSNNVIASGPASNSVAVVSPAAQAFVVSGSGAILVAGTQLMSQSFTKQSATSEIEVFVHTKATVTGIGDTTFEIVVDGNTSTVAVSSAITGALLGQTDYITLKAHFSGLSAGSHTVGIKAFPTVSLSANLNQNGAGPGKLILKETY